MKNTYLLIETRATWESHDVVSFLDMAAKLSLEKNIINLLLIQNAVIMAKINVEPYLMQLVEKDVIILIDDFSMLHRNINPDKIIKRAQIVDMKTIIKKVTSSGCKTIWH